MQVFKLFAARILCANKVLNRSPIAAFATMMGARIARATVAVRFIQSKQRPWLRWAIMQIRTICVPNHVAIAKRILVESHAT